MTGARGRVRPHRIHPTLAVALCALVAALVYIPTLQYQLVWDDQDIIVRSQARPLEVFAHSFWYGGGAGALGEDPYYRPLVNLSFGVDELIAGHRAWYFHLVNVLLHTAAVALACVVVWQVFGSVWIVLVAGFLCALHPLAADSVAYVSGRTDLLAGIGLLVALLGLLRLEKRHDWHAAIMMWLGFAVAVLSKETGVVFVLVAGMWVARKGPARIRREDWIATSGLLVMFLGYLAARYVVLGSGVSMSIGRSVGAWLLLSFGNFGRLVTLAAVPWPHGVFAWTQAGSGGFPWVSVVAVLYLVLPFAFRKTCRPREVLLAWFWALATLLPFVGLIGFGPVGRLLYVPGIGFVLLLLFAGREWAHNRRVVGIGLVVAALGYSLLAALTVLPQRMGVWRDGYTLFSRMISEAPTYPGAHFNYAFELRRRGDISGAVAEYRKAIALDPGMALAYSNLGAVLQSKGELVEAESLYLKTIELRPMYALAWNNLAIVRYRRGDGVGAVQAFRKAIALDPNDAGAVYNLGRLYQQAGLADSAALMFERAYHIDPDNSQIRASYGQTHGAQR